MRENKKGRKQMRTKCKKSAAKENWNDEGIGSTSKGSAKRFTAWSRSTYHTLDCSKGNDSLKKIQDQGP